MAEGEDLKPVLGPANSNGWSCLGLPGRSLTQSSIVCGYNWAHFTNADLKFGEVESNAEAQLKLCALTDRARTILKCAFLKHLLYLCNGI